MQPGSALLRAVTEWQRGGGWSGPGGGGAPVFLALGAMLGGSAWLLWPAAAWGGRGASRREDALVGIGLWLLAVLVPLLTGVRRPGALQWSVAPWLLAWGTAGARSLPPFRSRSSVGWAVVVGVLLVGVVPARWSLEHQAERTERVAFRLRAELPALLGSTDLCVSEFAWNAAEGDTLARRLLVLPKDSRAPARYDFAYWSRWYPGFRWVLLSGARVGENLGRQDADAARRFYAAVTRDGVLEREWGERDEGYRLYRIRDGSEWRRPFREAELGAFRGRKEMSWYLTQLGDRYLAVGDARAVEALSRVGLVWDPDSPALYSNLGVACLRLEDPAEAAKAFDAGLRLSPRSFELLWNLALACVQADLYPRAEMVLRRAVELRPEFAPAHYELGRVFLAQNKPGLARLAFERFLELDPSSAERGTVEEVLRHLAKDASP
jgi:tetratricopeptide (TPR) repeat protein